MAEEVTKSMVNADSVGLIFPLQTEVTIELSKIPEFAAQLSKLVAFYKKQLELTGQEIKGYDLSSEITPLLTFPLQLDIAIKASNIIKPIITSDPEKTSVSDYEFLTMRIIPVTASAEAGGVGTQNLGIQINGAASSEEREYSDGSKRQTIIYNKIDYIYLENKTTPRTLAVLSTLQSPTLLVASSTLALLFNHKEILKQINSPVPSSLLLCKGKETNISKIEDGLASFFGTTSVSSKVLLKDFLTAYIHPLRKITDAPRPAIPKGCTQEARNRISLVRSSMNLIELQAAIVGGMNFVSPEQRKKYQEDKKEFIELTKLCPDLVSDISFFDSVKDIQKLGKLFTDFLEKFNLACIVDEALKCVMPQLPCDEILRDLTVDNFEQRLQTAFPYQKNIIHAIVLNIQDSLEAENRRRQENGEEPLDPAGQSQLILDGINTVIDLEALCKIDIQAIIELIKNLFNFKLPSFNLFDWQFKFKIDLNLAIIEALLKLLLSIIEQVLNELIGCNALDGLIAGIINSNVESPSGLYGDLAAMFGGDFDFSNLQGIAGNGLQNFLTQSGDQLSKIIVFESQLGNNLLGTYGVSGTLGFGKNADNIIAGSLGTEYNSFGGIVRVSTFNTGGVGVAGFVASPTSFTGTFDVTKLASTEKQAEFLQEIGKFQVTSDGTQTDVVRISDDSIVQLLQFVQTSNENAIARSVDVPSTQEQAMMAEDPYTPLGVRNKNRHILKALANVGQNSVQIAVSQLTLADQLKEYFRTCFALLSPSETIDLLSGISSLEVKLTITEIARLRFPLLNGILKFPETHALMFATFGKLTQLDTIGPRLQLLSSDPTVKLKMVDPKICAPYPNLTDFRRALMSQVLPEDVANRVMDDLVEDDRQRANRLLDNLGKNPDIQDLLTNPAALSPNKTPDGKNIDEIDRAVDNTISNIFDQIKIQFDKELEAYPKAISAPVETKVEIRKYAPTVVQTVLGFNNPGRPEQRSVNVEYSALYAANGNQDATDEVVGDPDNFYFTKKVHDNQDGALVYQTYANVESDFKLEGQQFEVKISASLPPTIDQGVESARNLDDNTFGVEYSKIIKEATPRWNIKYKESSGSYYFDIRTAGKISSTNGNPVEYAKRLLFTGSIAAENPIVMRELIDSGLLFPEATLNPQDVPRDFDPGSFSFNDSTDFSSISSVSNVTRLKIFDRFVKKALVKVTNRQIDATQEEFNTLSDDYSRYIYKSFLSDALVEEPWKGSQRTNLLDKKRVSNTDSGGQLANREKAIFLSIIDFTPLPTEQDIACDIDPHPLQIEDVKKRIKKEYNSTTPANLVNNNSQINTRYDDNKPGHLSEKIMTGLAETFIRTSVLHNVFKGLFVFDKYDYSFDSFVIPEMIYIFFEYTVKEDFKKYKLEKDFEAEIEKIYNLYKKDDKKLIPEDDRGENKLRSIVKYHIDSILQIIKKIVGSYDIKSPKFPSQLPTLSAEASNLLRDIANETVLFGNRAEGASRETRIRTNFINNLPVLQPYFNLYKKYDYENPRPRPNTDAEDDAPLHSTSDPDQLSSEYLNKIFIPSYNLDLHTYKYVNNFIPGITDSRVDQSIPDFEFEDNKPTFAIERYIKLEFASDEESTNIPPIQELIDLKNEFYKKRPLNGCVSEDNFMSIVANFLNITKETELPTYFYKKDATDSERRNMWLKSIPKFGIRISLVHQYDYDDSVVNPYWPPGQTEEDSVVYGSIDNVKINGVSFPLLDFRQSTGGFTRDQSSTFEKNIKQKIGFIQTYRSYKIEENMVDRTEYFNNEFGTFYTKNRDLLRVSREVPRSLILRKAKRRMVMPILEKEIDLPEQLYNIDNSNPTSYFNFEPNTLGLWNAPWADSMRQILDSTYRAVKSEIINDPEFDILVNFCLLQGIGRNFSLFNSLVGLASEPIFKLLDGTKDLITKNYDIQKNSGNFNSRNNKGAYAKQKKQEQGGPPPLDFLKAAKTIPINLLKGISTAVDPNIFLADKIVLAGKMGFIQPKFKRVQEGDIIKIAGSDETVTITAEQSGVAYSGYYDYLETGELLIKPNPTDQGQPHTEFTVVALVDEQTNKIKKTTDSEGNQIVVTRQGPGVTGVPYDLKNKSFVDPNFKDTEEVEAFDIRPSTPIFPGESINIPYSVASLLLAPFPVFPPGASLTAYNLLMPFGPLFLALEPLIYETPEFKASIPKNNSKTEPKKDENGNVVCLEATPPVLRLTTVAILTALFFDESGNLRTFTYRNYEEFRQQARELLLQTLNNNSIVVEDSLLNSVVQEIATKITRGTLTKQSLKPILERLLR